MSSQEWVLVTDNEVICLCDAEQEWEGKGERHEMEKELDNKNCVRESKERIKMSMQNECLIKTNALSIWLEPNIHLNRISNYAYDGS